MKNSIVRGYAIEWSVVKKTWQSNYVTDLARFKELLSACPAKMPCLTSLAPANLCSLLSKAALQGDLELATVSE